MLTKKKPCNKCGELKMIWKNHQGNRYCQACWKLELPKSSQSNKPTAKQRPISKSSPKRGQMNLHYLEKRKLFLKSHPVCGANLSGCTTTATDVHHKAGRTGNLLLDESKWIALCRACHTWIETHPKEAKLMNFSLSRLEENDDNN